MTALRVISTSSPPPRSRRRGLTLLELVVVLAILVVLSSMLVPLIAGLGHQTNAATNATVADDVARAVRSYCGQFNREPDQWDSLLTTAGAQFDKLHTGLTGAPTTPLGPPLVLEAEQVESLTISGIANVLDASGTSPNNAHDAPRALAAGGKVSTISKSSAAGVALLRQAFGQIDRGDAPDNDFSKVEFVVFGLGSQSSLRNTTIVEVPLIQAADPLHHYARVLCVYKIPASGRPTFAAEFLGCLLPDGTSRGDNIDKYNNLQLAN